MFHFSLKTVIFFIITLPLIACQSTNTHRHSDVALGDKGQPAFKEFKAGNVEWVTIGNLLPTQMNLGQKQNAYKLARWQKEPHKMFEELCRTYGMRAAKASNGFVNATVYDPESINCRQPRAAQEGPLIKDQHGQLRALASITPVYVAPNGELYLTDGHHTNSRFHDMPGGGDNMPVLVYIAKNLSQLESMDKFWAYMERTDNTYLFDNGQPISYADLPRSLGAKSDDNLMGMGNDEYRSVSYFTRDIGWNKSAAQSIPFLEYYWAELYRPIFTINGSESIEAYSQLVLDIAKYTINLPDSYPLADLDKNAKALGKNNQLHYHSKQDVIEEIVCEWDKEKATTGNMKLGKLGWAFYQQGVAIKDFPVPCNEPNSYLKRYDLNPA